MSKDLTIKSESIFSTISSFEDGQRIAKGLASSDLVPAAYKNNIPNTMIALEMSNRLKISPFEVMQNLDIIKGKPSWSSTFIIASINSCGRFKPLRFEFVGTAKTDEYGCRAYTEDMEGNKLVGPTVTWLMVKSEGWFDKPGSKWKTMPEMMFQYRAASFFGRLYAPDILKGMQTAEEVRDYVKDAEFEDVTLELRLNELFEDKKDFIDIAQLPFIERIINAKEKSSYQKAIDYLENIETI